MTDEVEWVGYTYDDTRKIPFTEEDPLVFHVLTSVAGYDEGESALMDLMRDAASILPRAQARERWGDGEGLIFARDEIAGDDEYIFMTPCNVYTSGFSGDHGLIAQRNPAVAFRLSHLLDVAEVVAFRVHDLEPQYRAAETLANTDAITEQIDWGDDEDSDEIPTKLIEQLLADEVSDQIKAIAEFGTQYDTDLAAELIELYARFLGSFRDVGRSRVPESELSEFIKAVEKLVPDAVTEYWDGSDYAEELMVDSEADTIAKDWLRLFGGRDEPIWGFPWALRDRNSMDRPEVMVKGELLLCEAAFYRNSRGVWLPVPPDVCKAGQLTANRRRR